MPLRGLALSFWLRQPIVLLAAVFLATLPLHSQTLTVFHTFTGGSDGANSNAGLTRAPAGNFYGTTQSGGGSGCGGSGCGTLFEIDPPATNVTLLYSFKGKSDGRYPASALVLGPGGGLYGTTNGGRGCDGGCGTVFKFKKGQPLKVLHSFVGGTDGAYPNGLIIDTAGNLYGTTQQGGGSGCGGGGCGTVFKIDTAGILTTLYSFKGGTSDGYYPMAGLVMDKTGNLFGTTWEGGNSGCGGAGCGTVFRIDTMNEYSLLYSFQGTDSGDGENPTASLTIDKAGNLYGTTSEGGDDLSPCDSGCGTVFKIDLGGETVLYRFQAGRDGFFPTAGLTLDSSGNLYGTAYFGGTSSGCPVGSAGEGCGTIFRLSPANELTVLHIFNGRDEGGNPNAVLVPAPAGNFGTYYYGTSFGGNLGCGGNGCGAVYRLLVPGSGATL